VNGPPPILERYTPDEHALVGFWLPGLPKPQGSKRAVIHKHLKHPVVMESAGQPLKDWRTDAKHYAFELMAGKDMLVECPVFVHLFFVLKRAGNVPKTRPTPPAVKKNADVDKLARAMFDAFSGIVYADDCQVIEEFADKRIAELGEQTGCWVSVGRVLRYDRNADDQQPVGG
jgi:crossover junction endodeoxyribonuclease RusA